MPTFFACYRNPLGLSVGDWIRPRNTCITGYVDFPNKVIIRTPCDKFLMITGTVRKGLGRYHSACQYGDDGDYDPPFLSISEWVWLYECREQLWSKPVYVHPDDVVLT